jgi:uncharacterized protein YbbK (DUF523 family)
MLLAHHPEALDRLRRPTAADPLRVVVSGCLARWGCGVDGSDNGVGEAIAALLALPTVRALPFCPEQHTMGTPRSTPDLVGGDGIDVLDGAARVLDERGVDRTAAMIAGAAAMVEAAVAQRAELAILTDASGACGSQVVWIGVRSSSSGRRSKGVGVAAAALLRAGLPVVSQRDHRTLGRIRALLEPSWAPPAGLLDHHEHPWTVEHLPGPHPRA